MELLYSGHNWEPVLSPIASSGASSIFLVGVVLHNRAVEHNVAMFSELSLGLHWWGRG